MNFGPLPSQAARHFRDFIPYNANYAAAAVPLVKAGMTASLTSRRRAGPSQLMSGRSTFECYPLGSGGEYPPYVQILDPLMDQEGCLELSDEIPRRC